MGSGQLHAQAPAAAGDVSSDCWKRRQGNLQVLPEGVEEQLAGLAKYSVLVANAACDALAQGFAPGPGALMVWLAAGQQLASCDRGVAATYLRAGPTLFTIFNSLEPWTSQVLTMSKRARAAGIIQAYLAALAGVVQKQGKDFAERWWELGQALAEHDIAQAVDYFRRDPQMTLGHADVRDLAALLDEVRRVHRQAPVALQAFFGGALRVLADTGPAGLSAWTGEGLARAGEGAAELRRFFSLQDPESQAIVRRLAPGYAWRQRARYHRLALQAWLEVAPELVEDDGRDGDAQRNPGVRPGPGNRLYLPALFKSQEHAWLALLHAAGHLRFGMPVVARPGRVAESNGAVSAPQLAQDGTETATVARIVDLCEDLRVDLRIGEQVPGYWARICRYCEQQGLSDGSPGAYQRLYLEQLGHALHGELLQVPFDKLQSPDSNPQSSADMALRLADGRWLPELAPDEIAASYLPVHGPNWCNTPEAANLPGAEAQATPPQHGRQGSRRREAQSLPVPDIQPQRKPRPGRQAKDAPVAAPEGGSGGRSQAGAGSQPAISNSAESQGTEQPACRLPEWDCRENRYRLDWVQVFERSPRELDHARAMALLQEHAGVQRRIRRIVQSQKPTRMAHLRRQPDGDDLDLDAAVAYVIERRAGMSPEPRIYRRKTSQWRDIAVLCMADVSTSVMEKVPSGGQIIDRIRSGMLLFGDALAQTGDPFALYGFASNTRRRVHLYPIKRFSETYGRDAQARLGGMTGHWATRMGAALRFGTRQIASEPASRRLLLLLTDGRPSDYDQQDQRYLEEDTRMAVREAEQHGVRIFCISVDPRGGDYLSRIFGSGHYVVLNRIDDLPGKLIQVYFSLARGRFR